MDALKAAKKRALKDAQEMPLEAQIREREGFIERARTARQSSIIAVILEQKTFSNRRFCGEDFLCILYQ